MMNQALLMGSKLVIAVGFGLLFYHRMSEFDIAYIKFSLVDFIYENNLQFLFYILTALECIILAGIFFIRHKIASAIIDIAFAAYLLFIAGYFMVLMQTSGGCIECNYTTHFFNENIKVTLALLSSLFLVYAVFVRRAAHENRSSVHPV